MMNEASAMVLGLALGAGAVVPFLAWQIKSKRDLLAVATEAANFAEKVLNESDVMEIEFRNTKRQLSETDKIEQGYIEAIGKLAGQLLAPSLNKRKMKVALQDPFTIRALKRLEQQQEEARGKAE